MSESATPQRPSNVWWIVGGIGVGIVVFAVILAIVFAVTGRGFSSTPLAADSPSPTVTASETPTPVVTPTPTPTPASTDAPPLTADQEQFFEDTINSANTAVLDQASVTSSKVTVILAASECCGQVSRIAAIQSVTNFLSDTTDSWNFQPSPAKLAEYRASSYAQYFPLNSFVAYTANDFILSFVRDPDGLITTIFMSPGPLN